jgi:hypothetical protein
MSQDLAFPLQNKGKCGYCGFGSKAEKLNPKRDDSMKKIIQTLSLSIHRPEPTSNAITQ